MKCKIIIAGVTLCSLTLGMTVLNNNTFATSHQIEGFRFAWSTVPLGDTDFPSFYQNVGNENPFYISWASSGDHTAPLNFARSSNTGSYWWQSVLGFHPLYDDTLGKCTLDNLKVTEWEQFNYQYRSSGNNFLQLGFPFFPDSVPDSASKWVRCNRLKQQLNGTNFDIGSLPNPVTFGTNPRSYFTNVMQGYNYTTDGFWDSSHMFNSSDGTTVYTSLSISDLLGVSPDYFNELHLPLYDSSTDEDCTGSLASREVELKGSFVSDSPFELNSNLIESSSCSPDSPGCGIWAVVQSQSLSNGRNTYSDYFECTITRTTADNGTGVKYYFEFSCPISNYSPGFTDDLTHIYLRLRGNEGQWFWHNSGDITFGATFIVTDNNTVKGCSLHTDLTGSNIGGESEYGSGEFTDLTNLFNFTILNPFVNFFNAFTSTSSCASIPTLASMLHFEESQVCPFFDQTTRNIVTPIVSLSSMMLLFGFVVRWLNSSSGNYSDDSKGGKA